jgi:hypothetical protein
MPLLDHFRPPVSSEHSWESFHSTWANTMMTALNRSLPRRFMAEIQIHLGRQVEADVAEFDRGFEPENGDPGNGSGGLAVQAEPYAPPAVMATIPAVFPDDIEVQIMDRIRGRLLLAVIELVSPANKDSPESRRAFATKCAAYLQRGIGLVTLDIVSDMFFNLHDELFLLLGHSESYLMTPDAHTYATAYRPARRNDENQIDVWTFPLAVGQPLPVVPLALRATATVPLDLESTYTEARRNSRLD